MIVDVLCHIDRFSKADESGGSITEIFAVFYACRNEIYWFLVTELFVGFKRDMEDAFAELFQGVLGSV